MGTRAGVTAAGQVGTFGAITGIATANFTTEGNVPFNIKNNTTATIELSVRPAGGGGFVTMQAYAGWNVEIVAEIALDAGISDTDLSWGY